MNKKGFTLIELLAVIVIIAIIALIAIPQITKVVDEAKKGAAISSAYGYIDAVEKRAMILATKSNNSIPNGKYENLNEFNTEYKVDVSGKNVTKGFLVLEKNEVKSAQFVINNYKVVCDTKKCSVRDGNILTEISIEQNPTKTDYVVGDKLDLSGLVVKVKYLKGNEKIISSGIVSSPTNDSIITEEGINKITISYTEDDITLTSTFDITVKEKYYANRVPLTINKDTSKGGTITEENDVYTLSGKALLKSEQNISLSQGTFYLEFKNPSKFYENSSPSGNFAAPIIGVGNSGANYHLKFFGVILDGSNRIDAFNGTGSYIAPNQLNFESEWNKLAITYDGATTNVYLNGIKKWTVNSGNIFNTKLFVGGWLDAPYLGVNVLWGFANGQYRNIKVYNIALPESEL